MWLQLWSLHLDCIFFSSKLRWLFLRKCNKDFSDLQITMNRNPRWTSETSGRQCVNFRFSNFFLASIHLEVSYIHRLGLTSLGLVIKCIIYLPKLALKSSILWFELILPSKKPEAKSKTIPKWLFSEIFGKSLLLGPSSRYQRTQKY